MTEISADDLSLVQMGIKPSPAMGFTNAHRVFKRFSPEDFEHPHEGYIYGFFVTPDLNLSHENTIVKMRLNERYRPEFYKQLQKSSGAPKFIYSLSNLATDFPIDSVTSDTIELGKTYTNAAITVAKGGSHFVINPSISVKFKETEDLFVTNLIKLWTDYYSLCQMGWVFRSEDNLIKNIVDYASSLYIFKCGVDGSTIQYWEKYTGIWPASLPFSSLGSNSNSGKDIGEVDVEFKGSIKTFMNYNILEEFARLTNSDLNSTRGTARSNFFSSKTDSGTDIRFPNKNVTFDSSMLMPFYSAKNVYITRVPDTHSKVSGHKFKLVFTDKGVNQW